MLPLALIQWPQATCLNRELVEGLILIESAYERLRIFSGVSTALQSWFGIVREPIKRSTVYSSRRVRSRHVTRRIKVLSALKRDRSEVIDGIPLNLIFLQLEAALF